MPRRELGSLIGVAVLLTGPLVAILVLSGERHLDSRSMWMSVLSLSLVMAGLAVVIAVRMLLRAHRGKVRSEELVDRLYSAVHQTADAVFITDRSGTIEYVNPAFERTTGYSSDQAIGQTPRLLKSGEQATEYYANLWRTVLAGEPFRGSPVNRRRDGGLFHAEQTITPMTTRAGEITHFVSVMRDMTDRRLIEAQEIEMRLAASIQRKLLPQTPPQVEDWEFAGAVLPALATCGDYFDFITLRSGQLCLAIADACGHGVGPALIAVQTRAHLRALGQTGLELDQLLSRLDQILASDLDDELFVTMALVCIDAPTGSLEWVSAGHPTAYVFDADGAVKTELRSTGLPLGMLAGRPYTTGRGVTVEPGEVVLMMTDGFLECQNADGIEFGAHRLCEVVRASVSLPADQIMRRLHEAVRLFADGQPQQDDLTAVICRRLDGSPPAPGDR